MPDPQAPRSTRYCASPGLARYDAVKIQVDRGAAPAHHEVRASDVVARRLHGNLAAAAESIRVLKAEAAR
jgi:hypothetical protein